MEPIVGGVYAVGKKLGSGSFGEVRLGKNIDTNEGVAVKLEPVKSTNPQLLLESKIYDLIKGGTGVPRIYYYGTYHKYNVLVMDLLGLSIEDSFQANKYKKFNYLTTTVIGAQMVSLLEYMHNKNFLHRDIKPDNFMFGTGGNADQVYIIDLGLSKKYKSSTTGVHIAYREGKSLTGTARYASINTHKGLEQSRRDDLESVGYVLMYLLRGSLPWQGLQVRGNEDRYVKIMEKKIATPLSELCQGHPSEFVKFINACKSLKFEERPRYDDLRQLLYAVAKAKNGVNLQDQKTPNGICLRELALTPP